MSYQIRQKFIVILGLVILSSCGSSDPRANGIEVKFLVGSALKDFCDQAAEKLNRQNPKLENGKPYYLKCEAKGSGDVVSDVVSLATHLKQGSLPADAPDFPTLISVDGEIYQAQLQSQVAALFPGQNYIPGVADAALLTSSPMVFMVPSDLARGVRQQSDLYKSLLTAKTHKDLAPDNQSLPLYFVMGAPIRSNSGLQSLVAQFAAVSGKRPEDLTVSDVQKYQPKVREIQSKITRYGVSTGQIANDMAKNGPFWASIASVYESSVIEANANRGETRTRFEAIYPQATFTSNMRAILPNAPWVSADEKAAAEKTIEFLRSPEGQKIATELGLRGARGRTGG